MCSSEISLFKKRYFDTLHTWTPEYFYRMQSSEDLKDSSIDMIHLKI